jgi:hypothetical protein
MRRRKLLIGLGALSAGGSAAFGTEAFTSAQAERNVDVAVAGDRSSFIAIQPLDSSNGNTYVDTESDDTVELELDGDLGNGGGVAQDAITQLEDLFRVVNQGSQEVSVYFEDDSDAVTFRVTRSTGTSTNGSNGESLEGADNSVELAVGEQVVVGMTVDTLSNDVSGQLLDSVVLYADANASAPRQSVPEPQYVVTDSPSADNEFGDIQSAVNAAEAGSIVGIDGSTSLAPSSQINVDVEDVTLTGFNGKPTVDLTSVDPPGGSDGGGAVQIGKNGVTLQNFNIDYSADSPDDTNGIEANGLSDITVDGMRVENTADPDGSPAINTERTESVTVTNNEVLGAAIGVYFDGSDQNTSTINNNYVDLNPGADEPAESGEGRPAEGIFVYGDATDELSNNDLEIRNNEVVDKPSDEEGIKVLNSPSRINSESGTEAQLESLLKENDISKAGVNGELGTKSSGFSDIQSAVNAANRLTIVESGTYQEELTIDNPGFVLAGQAEAPTIQPSQNLNYGGRANIIKITADDVLIKNLEVDGNNPSLDPTINAPVGVYLEQAVGATIQNSTIRNTNAADTSTTLGVWAPSNSAVEVEESTFDNHQTGVFVRGQVSVRDSTLTNVERGINTNNINGSTTVAGVEYGEIAGNTVEASSLGIRLNNHYSNDNGSGGPSQSGTPVYSVKNNDVSGATEGINVLTIQEQSEVSLENNNISDCVRGYDLTTLTTSEDIRIDGGSVTNCDAGLVAFSADGAFSGAQYGGPVDNLFVGSDVTFQNNTNADIRAYGADVTMTYEGTSANTSAENGADIN